MKVIKRNGLRVEFDKSKIENAILNAMKDVNSIRNMNTNVSKKIAGEIEELSIIINRPLTIEEIQDLVEDKLIENKECDVAKSYIKYRYERNRDRELTDKLNNKIKNIINASNVTNDNANVDQASFSGKENRIAEEVSKQFARNNMVRKEVINAFDENYIYLHDFSKLPISLHNCLFADVGKLLRDGFETRNGGVRGARSIRSAMQNVAVIFQVQSQVQFGGVGSCCIDYELAPYVKYSLYKHIIKGFVHIEGYTKEFAESMIDGKSISVKDAEVLLSKYEKVKKYAFEMLEEEGSQHAEALFHNLNTLESRAGSQVPFTSINLGRDTSDEGRMVTRWILNASLAGVGKQNKTSIFPITIFQRKKGVNDVEGTPNYDLYKLATKSLSQRIYPNIVNCDWSMNKEDEDNPYTYMATMGCRTMIGYNRFTGNYDKRGRGNIVPTTMVLPRIAMDCVKDDFIDFELFWKKLDETLYITELSLIDRFNQICSQNPKSGIFMYENGTIKDYDKCDKTVYEAMKHGTLGFGYIGVAEMCKLLFGKYHNQDKDALDFAIKVINHIYDYSQRFGDKYNVNASCYATPAESSCHTIMKKLKDEFGIIDGVTDRSFLTNSHHVPVFENVNIKEKLQIESKFCKFATGGCITYVELDSTFVNNVDAIDEIIKYAMDLDIPYLAINFPIDTCLKCGYSSEINNDCPKCGSKDIERLRRVTGYLTTDYRNFNAGKQEEVLMRVKHNRVGDLDE